jgi:hypothetical protein
MKLLAFAAILEAATGLVLIGTPSLLASLLLGAELSAAGQAVGRIAGLALLALGLACWPKREPPTRTSRTLWGLLVYNPLVTIYLFYLGVGRELAGPLLWPAVAVHAVLTIGLARAWLAAEPK